MTEFWVLPKSTMRPALAGGLFGGVLLAAMGLGAWIIPCFGLAFLAAGALSVRLARTPSPGSTGLLVASRRTFDRLSRQSEIAKSCIALALTAAAIAANLLLEADPKQHAYLSISAPVVVAAQVFGFEIAGFALLFACTAMLYFFMPPDFSFAVSDPADVARLMEFAAFVGLSSWCLREMVAGAARQDRLAAGAARGGAASAIADAALEAALDEARQLHRGLRHRVRNEYHTLSLLAAAEAERSATPQDFRRWTLRLRSLSTVHELMDAGSADGVPMAPYLAAMAAALERSYDGALVRIETDVDAEIDLDYGAARKIGAIFVEAAMNALKHGIAEGVGGRVQLRLARIGRKCVLTVADDGKGCDPAAATPGYGLRLMQDLARSMGGDFELRRTEKGCVARCVFYGGPRAETPPTA